MSILITRRDDGYRLVCRQTLPHDVDEVFAFFADAGNLETLTPRQLRFQILSPQPIEMRKGALIDYRLRVHGFPLRWQSEITVWDPPYRFVDEQRRGPYRYWRHDHRFIAESDHTIVEDTVDYAPPGGRLMHGLLVRRDLHRIFRFRSEALASHFEATSCHEAMLNKDQKILPA